MLTEQIKVIKRFESFVLGFCACGCGQEIEIRRHQKNLLYRYKNHHHSKGQKYPNTPNGKNHPNYKTGRKNNGDYITILKPDDYQNRTKQRYVMEHVYIYEKHHKLCMLSWGAVHHKNFIKTDNKIENLEGMMKKDHIRLHNLGNKYNEKNMNDRKCLLCNGNTYKRQWNKYREGFICNRCFYKINKNRYW